MKPSQVVGPGARVRGAGIKEFATEPAAAKEFAEVLAGVANPPVRKLADPVTTGLAAATAGAAGDSAPRSDEETGFAGAGAGAGALETSVAGGAVRPVAGVADTPDAREVTEGPRPWGAGPELSPAVIKSWAEAHFTRSTSKTSFGCGDRAIQSTP